MNATRISESVNREKKQLLTEPPVRSPGAEFASLRLHPSIERGSELGEWLNSKDERKGIRSDGDGDGVYNDGGGRAEKDAMRRAAKVALVIVFATRQPC